VCREGASEEQDAFFHRLAAYRASLDLVAAHLARAVATQKDHVLYAIEADGAHCLEFLYTIIGFKSLQLFV